jgi:hypothetical protein
MFLSLNLASGMGFYNLKLTLKCYICDMERFTLQLINHVLQN